MYLFTILSDITWLTCKNSLKIIANAEIIIILSIFPSEEYKSVSSLDYFTVKQNMSIILTICTVFLSIGATAVWPVPKHEDIKRSFKPFPIDINMASKVILTLKMLALQNA